MITYVIALEAGVKVEVKENLKKDQVKKFEKNFSEVKNFVEDKNRDVVIAAPDKHIILGMMLQKAPTPDMISAVEKKMASLMFEVIEFINDLPKDKKVLDEDIVSDESKDDIEKATDEVFESTFESITKIIPGARVFMEIFDPKLGGIHIAGNLDKSFVLSTLLMNE